MQAARDVEIGQHESCPKLGHEFLSGVGVAAEAICEAAMKPVRCAGPVDPFVCERAGVAFGAAEGGVRR